MIEVNDAWLKILGYDYSEAIGKNFAEFFHPDWQDHFKENFPRFKAIGEVMGVEFQMRKKDGSYILVSFQGQISKNADGFFQQTHCIFSDITKTREMEDRLKQSHKLESIGTIAGGVAHDFNNMLSIIVGNVELVLDFCL